MPGASCSRAFCGPKKVFMEFIVTLIVSLLLAPIYFAPMLLAILKKHPHKIPIAIVNFFLGWTLVIWVGCLAWAFMPVKK